MNNIVKKITSIISVATVMMTTLPVMAQFEAYNDSDGFSLGHYTDTFNQDDRDTTEKMYQQRPANNRQFEYLTRGLTAVSGDGGTLVSWRFLGTDSNNLCYNLYRNGEKLNSAPLNTSSYFDIDAPINAEYTLVEVIDGTENGIKSETTAWDKDYKSFKVTKRDGYNIDDAAVGDLDGDGEYELLLRRVPSMDVKTRTTYPLIEAYELDGTHMWTIDEGPNEINEVDINILVYDMDGDGKSEVIMRSFEGTTDGIGNTIGDTNGDGITDYSKNENNLAIFKDRQYIVSTPEFLSVYKGDTGEEMDRTELLPKKEPLSEWSYKYTDTGRLTKRASHFLFGLAYLDGYTPSVVMVRGAWDNVRAAAWHIENGKFAVDWVHDTENKEDVNSIWGACNHNLSIADVDFDGKDEILSGPMAIDDDGSEMYSVKAYNNDGTVQKLGHGDAFDVAKMDPDYNGYLAWACHETPNLLANAEFHDARTGQVSWGYSKNKDTGRSRAADIDPTHKGFEVWASTGTTPATFTGENIADSWNNFKFRKQDGTSEVTGSLPMNFKVYWDGDLMSEFLDGTTISKWNWEDNTVDIIMEATECASNSGTKAVPCISADLFGDWREEIIWKTKDESEIRIYSTAIPTSYKIPTLMHDSYYRSSVAIQNNHYNQPPNVSYYLGAETIEVPVFEGYVIKDNEKIVNPDLKDLHGTYSIGNSGSVGAFSLKLLVNSPNAFVGNKLSKIDVENDSVVPQIIDERTLVPVRFIAESLGMSVTYDDSTREVGLIGNGYDVKMTLDSQTYTVNDRKYTLDVPAQSLNDRTMIPLRAMAEAIGMKVEWDGTNSLIYIGKHDFYDSDKSSIYSTAMKTGENPVIEVEITEQPTAAPITSPLDNMTHTEFKDDSGKTWNIYIDENYEGYSVGESVSWEGTKKPGILDIIQVANGNGGKVMSFGGSAKGSRNAVYTLPVAMTNKARIEFDWKTGICTGGTSYGELRFADSSKNVFFALKTVQGNEIQYSTGGAIANGGLETETWTDMGTGFNKDEYYHFVIEADFETNTCTATISQGKNTSTVKDIKFTNAKDFGAIEVLAVRSEKNFTWATELDNLKIGCITK